MKPHKYFRLLNSIYTHGHKFHKSLNIASNLSILYSSLSGSQNGGSQSGLLRCPANYSPLTPITFLDRSAKVFPGRTSLIYGTTHFTWSQTRLRCLKLASAITSALRVSPGQLVRFIFFSFFA